MTNENFVNLYLNELELIVQRILRKDIDKVINVLFETWANGSKVFLAGNGGSASTATHFACDLAKFTSVEGRKRFRALALTDNGPLISALTNDLGWQNVYLEQLKNLMSDGDVFVVISVHGGSGADKAGPWSQNLLKAAKFVKDNHGKVVGLAGFDGGMLKKMADACVVVPANSTPQVEGLHLVLTHLICDRLREMIAEYERIAVSQEIPQVLE
jgi:D-sedoheptulose 7-phosphate isomerase